MFHESREFYPVVNLVISGKVLYVVQITAGSAYL